MTFANFKEDLGRFSLKLLSSPLLDEYVVTQYNRNIQEAKGFGLIRKTFRFEDWQEPRSLNEVLREFGRENYWETVDKDGKVVKVVPTI